MARGSMTAEVRLSLADLGPYIEEMSAFVDFVMDGGDPRSIREIEQAFGVTHE